MLAKHRNALKIINGFIYDDFNLILGWFLNYASYHLHLENDLAFTVTMKSSGHAVVTGTTFQERPNSHNILEFEMEPDQTRILPVIQAINGLEKIYGGIKGIKEMNLNCPSQAKL